jgi:hypothetical protein
MEGIKMIDNTMIANQDVIELLNEIKRIREYKDTLTDQEKHLVQRLHNIVTEHEKLITVDEHGISKTVATWKYAKDSERFDSKLFKESNPSLYQEYVKITPGTRTLRIAK